MREVPELVGAAEFRVERTRQRRNVAIRLARLGHVEGEEQAQIVAHVVVEASCGEILGQRSGIGPVHVDQIRIRVGSYGAGRQRGIDVRKNRSDVWIDHGLHRATGIDALPGRAASDVRKNVESVGRAL